MADYFDVRRVRVRPEFAELYPEITRDVWMSASKATRLARMKGPSQYCRQHGCARGRVLCEVHFEFRGGRRGRQYLTGEWTPRVALAGAGVR
jgi:hypothetical protein